MTATSPALLERMRQQFDEAPYPRKPLDDSPRQAYAHLYTHNLVTPYYFRHQKITSTEGKLILDVGCGSGYTSLVLAEANPGAKIVGMDISSVSIDLAQKRLAYHGFDATEFHVMGVEDLPSLGLKFDYINCDEVLYLLPDPIAGLQSMREVLSPGGIIRANFHSSLQRKVYLQIQEFADMIGLLDSDEQEQRITFLRDIMMNLKSVVWAKKFGWNKNLETDDHSILTNHLLRGDQAWTIPEFFSAIRQSNLEFIRMVDWKSWDLADLFSDISDLPIEIGFRLAEASQEEQLHMFELLNPSNHRLLDIWVGHADRSPELTPIADWSAEAWERAQIYLHPQLNHGAFREDLTNCLAQGQLFNLTNHLASSDEGTIDNIMAGCLIPLIKGPSSFSELVQRWLMLQPLNPLTLQPRSESDVRNLLIVRLVDLEDKGYLLIQKDD
jgi:2-polyprenyl-3-methyl-5-hydroxy-6-metoxy-1,4-benzoquinol methylase